MRLGRGVGEVNKYETRDANMSCGLGWIGTALNDMGGVNGSGDI